VTELAPSPPKGLVAKALVANIAETLDRAFRPRLVQELVKIWLKPYSLALKTKSAFVIFRIFFPTRNNALVISCSA
jgi:hypothetical protein